MAPPVKWLRSRSGCGELGVDRRPSASLRIRMTQSPARSRRRPPGVLGGAAVARACVGVALPLQRESRRAGNPVRRRGPQYSKSKLRVSNARGRPPAGLEQCGSEKGRVHDGPIHAPHRRYIRQMSRLARTAMARGRHAAVQQHVDLPPPLPKGTAPWRVRSPACPTPLVQRAFPGAAAREDGMAEDEPRQDPKSPRMRGWPRSTSGSAGAGRGGGEGRRDDDRRASLLPVAGLSRPVGAGQLPAGERDDRLGDRFFRATRWVMLVMLFLGFGAAIWEVWKISKQPDGLREA